MFPKRFKIGSTRNDEFRCCFCLHVRTATILLGIWHLILHILAMAVLALLMRNHNAVMQRNEDFEQNNFLPTPLSKIKDDDNPYYLPTTQDGRTIYSSDIDMGALMTVCTLCITLLMVHGAIRGKATHLLPFFCLQLFDFAITTLTATGYFCYLRSVHRLVADHWHNLPFRNELLKLSPQYLSLLVLGVFLVSMLWKAYCIGIVWRCYKYLTLRQQTLRNTIHILGMTRPSDHVPEPDYSTLLREQEGAFGGAMKQTPPPSYQDIMDDQPPPYPAAFLNEVDGAHSPHRFQVIVQNNVATSQHNAAAAAADEPSVDGAAAAAASGVDAATPSNAGPASQESTTPAAENATSPAQPIEIVVIVPPKSAPVTTPTSSITLRDEAGAATSSVV